MSTTGGREEDWRGELNSHLPLSPSKLGHTPTSPSYGPGAKRSSRRFWEESGFVAQGRGGAEAGREERGGGGVRRSGMDAPLGGAGRRRHRERAESGGPGAGDVLFLVSFSHLLVINKLKFSHNFSQFLVILFDNLVTKSH
jgi:hypothetical protein